MARRTYLLLDTCAAIWLTLDEPMGAQATAAIDEAAGNGWPLRLSLITAWELGLLAKSGRAAMSRPPDAAFNAMIHVPGIAIENLTAEILVNSSLLPLPLHGDPADRIIIATARALDLTIVTRDEHILAYADRGHVRAIPC